MPSGRFLPVAFFVAAVASSGCGDSTSGTVTVEWSINRTRGAFQCAALSADAIQVHVVSDAGLDAGTWVQRCELFTTNVYLGRGGYSATAVLLDPAGKPRTPTSVIVPFRLAGNDEVLLSVDFPTSTFY